MFWFAVIVILEEFFGLGVPGLTGRDEENMGIYNNEEFNSFFASFANTNVPGDPHLEPFPSRRHYKGIKADTDIMRT